MAALGHPSAAINWHPPIWLGRMRPRVYRPANDIRRAAEKAFSLRLKRRIDELMQSGI
jgi:hypothetical protein